MVAPRKPNTTENPNPNAKVLIDVEHEQLDALKQGVRCKV
jgi:hypothetical protein